MKISGIIGLLFTVSTGVLAQLALKHGSSLTPFDLSQPKQTILTCSVNPFMWLWILSAVLSALSWIWVVTRFELSIVFPVATAAMLILVVLGSNFFFGEPVSVFNWLGVTLICIGIFLVLQS